MKYWNGLSSKTGVVSKKLFHPCKLISKAEVTNKGKLYQTYGGVARNIAGNFIIFILALFISVVKFANSYVFSKGNTAPKELISLLQKKF